MDCHSARTHAQELHGLIVQSFRPGRVITDNLAATLRASSRTMVELARDLDEEVRLLQHEVKMLREDLHALRRGTTNVARLPSRPRLVVVANNDEGPPTGGTAA